MVKKNWRETVLDGLGFLDLFGKAAVIVSEHFQLLLVVFRLHIGPFCQRLGQAVDLLDVLFLVTVFDCKWGCFLDGKKRTFSVDNILTSLNLGRIVESDHLEELEVDEAEHGHVELGEGDL